MGTSTSSNTVYDGPPLTPQQIVALATIAGAGDLTHVHPARAQALHARGLIDWPASQGTRKVAWLTDLGKQVLAGHGGAA